MTSNTLRARSSGVLLVGLLALAGPPVAAAATRPGLGSELSANAALRYWPAFHFLPATTPEQEKLLTDFRTAPLDADAKALTAAADLSLRYLRDGAAQARGDWGLEYEQGFALLLPHLQKGRTLARLACLRARQRFEAGDATGGVDDAADAMALGRHLSPDGILIAVLVRYAVEAAATDTVSDHLPKLPPAALDRLSARLDGLPAALAARDSVRIEREFGQAWAARTVRAMPAGPDFAKRVVALMAGSAEGAPAANIVAAVAAAGGTPEGVARQIEAIGPFYDEVAAALALPYAQAGPRLAEIRRRAKANAFADTLLADYARVLDAEARANVRLTMLRAAIALTKGGPEKVRDFRDPFGDGPLEHRPLANGFELRSKLMVRGEPVVLRVGQVGAK